MSSLRKRTSSEQKMGKVKRPKKDELDDNQPTVKKALPSRRLTYHKLFEDGLGETPEGIPFLIVISNQVEEFMRVDRILSILTRPEKYIELRNPKLLLRTSKFRMPITTEKKCFLFCVKKRFFQHPVTNLHVDHGEWITANDKTDPEIVTKSTSYPLYSNNRYYTIDEYSPYLDYQLVIIRAVHAKDRRLKKMICYVIKDIDVISNVLIIYNYESSKEAMNCQVPEDILEVPSKPNLVFFDIDHYYPGSNPIAPSPFLKTIRDTSSLYIPEALSDCSSTQTLSTISSPAISPPLSLPNISFVPSTSPFPYFSLPTSSFWSPSNIPQNFAQNTPGTPSGEDLTPSPPSMHLMLPNSFSTDPFLPQAAPPFFPYHKDVYPHLITNNVPPLPPILQDCIPTIPSRPTI